MRRVRVLVPLLAVLLAGIVVSTRFGVGAGAQEATPPPEEEFALPEGLTFEPFGYGTIANLPADQILFQLFRLRLEPGTVFQAGEDDPSLALVYVESGELTATVAGPMTVLRAAGPGTPFPEATEEFAAGEAFTMGAGDSAIFPPEVDAEVRNEGDGPVALLVAETSPAEGAGQGTPAAEGTPAPSRATDRRAAAPDVALRGQPREPPLAGGPSHVQPSAFQERGHPAIVRRVRV